MASTSTEPQTQHIHQALVAVAGELAKMGVTKTRMNEQQHFKFRGIDDVMNAVSPILAKHDVLFTMKYMDYPDVERPTRDGRGSLIYTKVKGDFTFTSAKDGSWVTVTTFGVAMDSADKAMNKAMSAALKYALLQTFLIPTESTDDADATTPEATVPKPPAGFEEWFTDLIAASYESYPAFEAAFKAGREDYRLYARTYRQAEGGEAKQRALAIPSGHVERQPGED